MRRNPERKRNNLLALFMALLLLCLAAPHAAAQVSDSEEYDLVYPAEDAVIVPATAEVLVPFATETLEIAPATDTIVPSPASAALELRLSEPVHLEPVPAATITTVIETEVAGKKTETSTVTLMADVIKVSSGRVYINRGEADGIHKGMPMTLFVKEEIRDLNDAVLGHEELEAGKLEVAEVQPGYSVARVVKSTREPERGMHVRYEAPAPAAPEVARGGVCPAGMLFLPPGTYSYYPWSPGGPTQQPVSETLSGFCIDMALSPFADWESADAACRLNGRRLCAGTEYRRVCAMTRELKQSCPEGQSCIPAEFGTLMEWTFEGAAGTTSIAGSCKCLGTSPSCAGCYNPGCPGIERRYRCCIPAAEEK